MLRDYRAGKNSAPCFPYTWWGRAAAGYYVTFGNIAWGKLKKEKGEPGYHIYEIYKF